MQNPIVAALARAPLLTLLVNERVQGNSLNPGAAEGEEVRQQHLGLRRGPGSCFLPTRNTPWVLAVSEGKQGARDLSVCEGWALAPC